MSTAFRLRLITFILAAAFGAAAGQDSVTVAADSVFVAGGMHRLFFGDHWRSAWALPVTVPLLPEETDTRLLRPLSREAPDLLPEELRVSFAGWIVHDQISSAHPFATAVVDPIARFLGLDPERVTLAAQSRSDGSTPLIYAVTPGGGHSSTREMIASITADPRQRSDNVTYAKMRLVDLLTGNAHRLPEAIRWKKAGAGLDERWTPAPENFDGALAQFDGVLPTLADEGISEIAHTGASIGNVEDETIRCRSLDRRLLGGFSRKMYDSLASWIQAALTDEAVDSLIRVSRSVLTQDDTERITSLLKSRRDGLPDAALAWYRSLALSVEVYGSDQPDTVVVRRIGRHVLSVSMRSGGTAWERIMSDEYTNDVRIFLLDGSDVCVVEGEQNSPFTVIINGGPGRDSLMDRTQSRSLISSLGALRRVSAGETFLDDPDAGTVFEPRPQTRVLHSIPYHPPAGGRDWGSDQTFTTWLDINPDDGLFLGGGPTFTRYGYRKDPFVSQTTVLAGISTFTGKMRLDLSASFYDWIDGARFRFRVYASQLDLSNYFGPGNETSFEKSLERAKHYKSDQQQLFLRTAVDFSTVAQARLEIAGTLKIVDNNPSSASLLYALNPPFARGTLTYAELSLHGRLDTRDDPYFPTTGAVMDVEAGRLPGIFDNPNSFSRLRGEVRFYRQMDFLATVVAVRAAGEKIWGTHPFFESAFIGGNGSVRGFERQRFAGDASATFNGEVRSELSRFTLLVPMWFGVSAFAETGRVFLSSESSERWHGAAGGGFWIAALHRTYVLSVTIGSSRDQTALYASLGFPF